MPKSIINKLSGNNNPEETGFGGSYGFVIVPDANTKTKTENLARELFPKAEYQATTPHVTLYQGRVAGLPPDEVRKILNKLKGYSGETLALDLIDIYGGKFAFWNNEKNTNLSLVHTTALEIAAYLDKNTIQRSVEEGLDMSPEELENVRKFGYPFVGESYRPHITLAYDSQGLTLPTGGLSRPWEMKIEDVLFVKMGKYGSVAEVIEI